VGKLPDGTVGNRQREDGKEGFRAGEEYGVQFHPEYDMATARNVTAGKDELSDDRKERVYYGITDENYDAACNAKQLFENFTAYVNGLQAVEHAAD
jgi:GMP synthase (glutamine-hydrolysing)